MLLPAEATLSPDIPRHLMELLVAPASGIPGGTPRRWKEDRTDRGFRLQVNRPRAAGSRRKPPASGLRLCGPEGACGGASRRT